MVANGDEATARRTETKAKLRQLRRSATRPWLLLMIKKKNELCSGDGSRTGYAYLWRARCARHRSLVGTPRCRYGADTDPLSPESPICAVFFIFFAAARFWSCVPARSPTEPSLSPTGSRPLPCQEWLSKLGQFGWFSWSTFGQHPAWSGWEDSVIMALFVAPFRVFGCHSHGRKVAFVMVTQTAPTKTCPRHVHCTYTTKT